MAKVFMADEVKKHNTRKSVWIVYRNEVYDVTKFLEEHPGGEDPLLEAAGQDATIAFDAVGHSADAISLMKKFKVGSLAPGQGCCKMRGRIWKSSRRSSKKSIYKAPSSPKAERRIQKIVVPRESPRRTRSRAEPPPAESSKLKWALLALGLAIIMGVAYKKYSSG